MGVEVGTKQPDRQENAPCGRTGSARGFARCLHGTLPQVTLEVTPGPSAGPRPPRPMPPPIKQSTWPLIVIALGAASIFAGLWLVSVPLALIVLGGGGVAVGLVSARA